MLFPCDCWLTAFVDEDEDEEDEDEDDGGDVEDDLKVFPMAYRTPPSRPVNTLATPIDVIGALKKSHPKMASGTLFRAPTML